ncbi:MAG: hypothetical protein KDB35_18890, partial [Acidimicrobiales bacterium]|nr:hypothetical protein [Acidimicrobiales bacterium]
GCFDPKGCLPWWIVLPGAVLYALGRGVGHLLAWLGRRLVGWRDERRRARGWTPRVSTSAQIGPPLRPPAEWADAQRAFRSTYAADPESVPRRPATIAHDGALVTVVLRDGRGRRMTFETTPDTTALPVRGEVDGFLVGELGTNATAGVEVAGGVLWPVYNPVGR